MLAVGVELVECFQEFRIHSPEQLDSAGFDTYTWREDKGRRKYVVIPHRNGEVNRKLVETVDTISLTHKTTEKK